MNCLKLSLPNAPRRHPLWRAIVAATLLFLSQAQAQQPDVAPEALPRLPLPDVRSALASMEVAAGFGIEAVAWEPLVVDPVAMSFDEQGRLYVVEMRDYSERRPEQLGRVRILEDRDRDGVMDWSSVFADGLPWPTAVICYDGGIFVGATPDIYFLKDHDGDGRAEERRVAFTGFASDYAPYQTNRLNVQALMNSFRWGIDNRIHGVASGAGGNVISPERPGEEPVPLRGRDFSFNPKTLSLRAESGGAQHGMSFDDWGRKFVCSNSDHIQQVVYAHRYAGRNPRLSVPSPRVSIAVDGPAAPVFRLSPDEAWRVIRTQWRVAGRVGGPVEGGGRPSGYFTGATGVTIYRGDQWPREFVGSAIIGDCGSNLIHRKQLHPMGILMRAERYAADAASELVASRDNGFRPVQFANAPDGTLWVVDMCREIIEHPWSLPGNIKQHLDLNHGNRHGRLFRIRSQERPLPDWRPIGQPSSSDLVDWLSHPNAWHRDTAARLLFERADPGSRDGLRTVLREGQVDTTRVHALYGLAAHGWLTDQDLQIVFQDPSPVVRVQGLKVLEEKEDGEHAHWGDEIEALLNEPDPFLRQQLAHSLGELAISSRLDWLYEMYRVDYQNEWVRFAILNSVGAEREAFWSKALGELSFWNTAEAPRRELFNLVRMVSRDLGENAMLNALQEFQRAFEPDECLRFCQALLSERRPDRRGPKLNSWRSQLAPTIAAARQMLESENVSGTQVANALDVLVGLAVPDAEAWVKRVISRGGESELMSRAIRSARELRSEAILPWLAGRLSQFLPGPRRAFLDLYFDQASELSPVLEWLEQGVITKRDLNPTQRNRLIKHQSAVVSERAQQLLIEEAGDANAELERLLPALLAEADLANGKRVFVERCALCHQLGSLGVAVGPAVPSMRGARKRGILESILFPNREVAPQYQGVTVDTDDASQTGILVAESDRTVTIRQPGGIEATIDRQTVRSVRSEGMSLMPSGLLEDLGPQSVADLLDFLMYGESAEE